MTQLSDSTTIITCDLDIVTAIFSFMLGQPINVNEKSGLAM